MFWLWKKLSRLEKLFLIFWSPILIDRLFSLSNNEQFCKAIGWAPWTPMDFILGKWKCPVGTVELYRDIKWGILENRFCCHVNNENYNKKVLNAATKCRATSCQATSPNPCTSLNPRYINLGETQLQYQEIARESCTLDNDDEGVIVLCCVRNSTESYLSPLIGAEPHEFPHMAELVIQSDDGLAHSCGGTIYNHKFIITAAHCITYPNEGVTLPPEMIKIILGSNIAEIDEDEYVYPVRRLIAHPYFRSMADTLPKFSFVNPPPKLVCPKMDTKASPSATNDIALVELDRDINFGRNVRALEIAQEGFHPLMHADNAIILGWGTNAYTLDTSMYLQNFNFRILDDHPCFQGNYIRFSGQRRDGRVLCLGGDVDGKIQLAGEGDSGGPAICRGPHRRAVLCGVASTAGDLHICLKEGICLPNVYVRVSHYHDWIKDVAGEQEVDTLYQPFLFGEDVGPHRYPHQVHITSYNGKPCGGTLIAHNLVLTLARCILVPLAGPGSYDFLLGLLVTVGSEDQIQTLTMELASFYHGDKLMFSDIDMNSLAIIKLRSSVTFPIRFPNIPRKGDTFDGETGMAIAFPTNPVFSVGKLQKREFQILNRSNCQHRADLARVRGKIGDEVICGVEKYSGGFKCDWELGGGVICGGGGEGDKSEILCGVQFADFCEFSAVAVFINMAHYSEWVRGVVAQLSE